MLRQDIRYAFRSLTSNPGFTAIAVACLALGIGVNATIFSVVDGVILKPHPYPDPERIVVIQSTNRNQRINRGPLSYADVKDIREGATTLESVAAFANRSLTISGGTGEPERFSGLLVGGLFSIGVLAMAWYFMTNEQRKSERSDERCRKGRQPPRYQYVCHTDPNDHEGEGEETHDTVGRDDPQKDDAEAEVLDAEERRPGLRQSEANDP